MTSGYGWAESPGRKCPTRTPQRADDSLRQARYCDLRSGHVLGDASRVLARPPPGLRSRPWPGPASCAAPPTAHQPDPARGCAATCVGCAPAAHPDGDVDAPAGSADPAGAGWRSHRRGRAGTRIAPTRSTAAGAPSAPTPLPRRLDGLQPTHPATGVLGGDERQHIRRDNHLRGGLPTTVKNTFRSYATAATVFGRERTARNSRYASSSGTPNRATRSPAAERDRHRPRSTQDIQAPLRQTHRQHGQWQWINKDYLHIKQIRAHLGGGEL
jgi:hypothetical protein